MTTYTSKAPEQIISDEEINRVHANSNFGDQSPRDVVNEGVWRYSIGWSSGHTMMQILREHGLITKPKGYRASLTEKGKAYARSIISDLFAMHAENERLRERCAGSATMGGLFITATMGTRRPRF